MQNIRDAVTLENIVGKARPRRASRAKPIYRWDRTFTPIAGERTRGGPGAG